MKYYVALAAILLLVIALVFSHMNAPITGTVQGVNNSGAKVCILRKDNNEQLCGVVYQRLDTAKLTACHVEPCPTVTFVLTRLGSEDILILK